MQFIYKILESIISVHENPIISLMILGLFDVIAYKIAYKAANGKQEHWTARAVTLVILTLIYVVVNIFRFVTKHWFIILVALISLLGLFALVILILVRKDTFTDSKKN